MPELEARIRVVTRGRDVDRNDSAEMSLTCGALTIDLVHHDVTLDGANVALTTKKFEVLAFLARHAGKTCTHQMILGAVWVPATAPKPSTCTPTSTGCARS